jgi:subtilisin family serine protease
MIGIVDSGLDVSHEDFLHPDGSTRVLFYWDQSDSTGTPPGTFGFGTEWTAGDLDGGLFPGGDRVGHGTHVTGIAAGTGRAANQDSLRYRYAGVAPEADLVVVAADLLLDTGVLDAVNYIFETATGLGKPAVVNLSLGSQFGPHDGTTPLDLGIDALTGAGRLVVASAGNEGDDRVHAELHVPSGGSDSTLLSVPTYVSGNTPLDFFIIDAFYREPDSMAVTVVTPGGSRFGPYLLGLTITDVLTGEGTLFLTHQDSDPSTTNLQVQFDVSNFNPDPLGTPSVPPPAVGTWTVVFTDLNGSPGGGEVDLWMAMSSIVGLGGAQPLWIGNRYDPTEEVASPGTANRVVTVGSYNTKACWPVFPDTTRCNTAPGDLGDPGKLTFFSSRGPTRDDRLKPEVVAPGFVVTSALSNQMTAESQSIFRLDRTLDPDERHFVFAGTSMSAPHVTGALALWLQTDPSVTPGAVQSRIEATAAKDSHTGPGWTPEAGFGKLDVAALVDSVVAVRSRELRVETTPEGRPRLRWGAGPDDPVASFVLKSVVEGEAWRERVRFQGPGPHAWVDRTTGSDTRYRLTAMLRDGDKEIWAEVLWRGTTVPGSTVRAVEPNPFRAGTRIVFHLGGHEEPARFEAVVFGIPGRVLRKLEGRTLATGEGTVEWDGTDAEGRSVSAGVYWIRIRVGSYSRSTKVVRLP